MRGVGPIGKLYLEAEKKSKKTNRLHESRAACGCFVTVDWFSKNSRQVFMNPCSDHNEKRTVNASS